MMKTLLAISLAAWMLTACAITITTATPANSTPLFITATLPATRTPYAGKTPASATTQAPAVTAPANCKDIAVLVQDVTVPDGTNLAYGLKFTKTWQFRNTGTCPWIGYSIAFASGDRMEAPDAAPILDTAPKSNVNISVDLVAPVNDGLYTGFFELRTASGKVLPIGIEKTFWVKITVGNVTLPTLQAAPSVVPTVGGTLTTPRGPKSCTYVNSGSYPGEIVQLINKARVGAGLPALAVNAQLAAAAQAHSIDMACFSLLSRTGTDGSTIQQRVAAAGYGATFSEEMIYGGYGAYPQTAFDWWMNDPAYRAVIMDSRVRDIGAGFTFVEDSAHGDYYTVDVGSQ